MLLPNRYWSVLSGPSIRDLVPILDCQFDEDGMVSQSTHALGAKCACNPDKVGVGSIAVAGIVEIQFHHKRMTRRA